MSESNPSTGLAADLARLADELRALSNAGCHYTQDPYQIERYKRILEISSELMSWADTRPLPAIQKHFFQDIQYMTPLSAVDSAVFDQTGRLLLVQRADDRRWALPGGGCEVGELPATTAVREIWEETGCIAEVTEFLGVFDHRFHGGRSLHHLYCLLFAAHHRGGTPRVTRETLAVQWFAPAEIPWDELSGTHPARIRHALGWHADPTVRAHFDWDSWDPAPTFQHTGDDEA